MSRSNCPSCGKAENADGDQAGEFLAYRKPMSTTDDIRALVIAGWEGTT